MVYESGVVGKYEEPIKAGFLMDQREEEKSLKFPEASAVVQTHSFIHQRIACFVVKQQR